MKPDVRSRNVNFSGDTIAEFSDGYLRLFVKAFEGIDRTQLDLAVTTISEAAARGSYIYVAGNGGSASISDHLCCDMTKGTHVDGGASLRTMSLVSNVALITAISNDFSYQESISTQVKYLMKSDDILILISSSGASPNILSACRAAQDLGAKVIGFTGFEGGELKKMSNISIHVPAQNYGVVEDCHQALMHVIAQFIYKTKKQNKA